MGTGMERNKMFKNVYSSAFFFFFFVTHYLKTENFGIESVLYWINMFAILTE